MMMNAMAVRQGGFRMDGSMSPGHSGGPQIPMNMNMNMNPMTPMNMMDRTPLTPMSMHQQQQQQQQQLALPQSPGGSISLAVLIDFITQRTYHELTVLAELLPRKTDMERKQEIFNFSSRTRLLFVRLLALVKWASSASKVDKSVHIMGFLEKQSMLFIETADVLSRIARETLVHARLPNFHIPAAVEVLISGSYNRLPSCIRDRIVPPDPITAIEKKSTLNRLNQVVQHRLVSVDLPVQMRDLKVEAGRVTFRVENEFEVSLTVLGDSPTTSWKIIDITILVDDQEIGEGMPLVHSLQSGYLLQLGQARIDNSSNPLKELYDMLHTFAQSLQLEVLYTQVLKLCRERLGDYLIIEEYIVGKSIIVGYWRELSQHDPRAELGYRVIIAVDAADPSQPLCVTHQPTIHGDEVSLAAEDLRTNQLEKFLIQIVHLRSRHRLVELKKEIELNLAIECSLDGSPPVLSVPILATSSSGSSSSSSQELRVTVSIHTGTFLVHVPQYDPSPRIVTEIEQRLNSPIPDTDKLKSLISQLRYWLTERRCEMTLQHLPASASDKITLLKWDENPVLRKIGPHRLTVKFQKHPYAILIVEFKEKDDESGEMDFLFYLVIVKKASAEENEDLMANPGVGTNPKFYLKPVSVMPLDTFACTHGPYTEINIERPEITAWKRKLAEVDQGKTKKPKYDGSFYISELAHVVAMCDERLPFSLLTTEFQHRDILNTGCSVEANGTCLLVTILRFPTRLANIPPKIILKLNMILEYAKVRSQMQLKGFRTWNLELRFAANKRLLKIQNALKPVHFVHEMAVSSEDHVPKIVDTFLDDWIVIAKLFYLLERSNWLTSLEESGHVLIKSFTWNKLVINYGPNRSAVATIQYIITEKYYKLSFGGPGTHNPHTLMRLQLQSTLNSRRRNPLEALMRILCETYEPLYYLTKLPTTPQLGAIHNRPQLPIQTFILIPQSPNRIRIVYSSAYCLDVNFMPEGLVSIRDGAYSQFERSQVLGELTPTQGLKAFLSKYVDENAVFRRRSQSEDDNPPSPILEMDHSFGTPTGGPGSSSSFPLSAKPQSPAPGRSNPHTPASPHIQQERSTTGFSPATSFANLSSPPSLPHIPQNSPNPSSVLPHPSPQSVTTNMPAPSPSGGPLSVPTPSPNPTTHANLTGSQSGPASASAALPSVSHSSPFFHPDSSPAAVQSPWGMANSPGMPRPSPARVGQSPQSGHVEGRASFQSRVLPQRSWAGAIPTVITHDALDILCTPVTSVENQEENPLQNSLPHLNQGHPCCPIERFLGCSYLRRQLQRIVQAEEHLTLLPSQELGVLMFKSETMQFRVGLDMNHFQSLHLKITPVPESQWQWNAEEIQLLELFFSTKVVRPPFRPNGVVAFARMVSLPPKIIRDCIKIIRVQLIPSIVEQQGWLWRVQFCLTVPPAAIPIIPQGMPAVVISQSKFLIFLLLTRVQPPAPTPMETDGNEGQEPPKPPRESQFIVAPLIHETIMNVTSLAEKRASPGYVVPPECSALSQHLKRFADFTQPTLGMECSLFPAVQDILASFSFGQDGHGHGMHMPPMDMPPQMGMGRLPPQMGQQFMH